MGLILGGAIGSLLASVIQQIISWICNLLVGIFGGFAGTMLGAVSRLSSKSIDAYFEATEFGTLLTSIQYVGLGICLFLTIWEFVKYYVSIVTGEQVSTSPQNILGKFVIYTIFTRAAVSFSKVIFDIGQGMFSAIYEKANISFTAVLSRLTPDAIGDSLTALKEGFFDNGIDEWVLGIIPLIAGTILIIVALWNFLKYIFSFFVKFGTMILYVYLSPLAVGCGASPRWKGVFDSWLKNFICTMVLWCVQVWGVYASILILSSGSSEGGYDWLLWAGLSYGFVKGAMKFEEILQQLGMSVVKTSGSVLQDLGEVAAGVAAATTLISAGLAGGAAAATKAAAGGKGIIATTGRSIGGAVKGLGKGSVNLAPHGRAFSDKPVKGKTEEVDSEAPIGFRESVKKGWQRSMAPYKQAIANKAQKMEEKVRSFREAGEAEAQRVFDKNSGKQEPEHSAIKQAVKPTWTGWTKKNRAMQETGFNEGFGNRYSELVTDAKVAEDKKNAVKLNIVAGTEKATAPSVKVEDAKPDGSKYTAAEVGDLEKDRISGRLEAHTGYEKFFAEAAKEDDMECVGIEEEWSADSLCVKYKAKDGSITGCDYSMSEVNASIKKDLDSQASKSPKEIMQSVAPQRTVTMTPTKGGGYLCKASSSPNEQLYMKIEPKSGSNKFTVEVQDNKTGTKPNDLNANDVTYKSHNEAISDMMGRFLRRETTRGE